MKAKKLAVMLLCLITAFMLFTFSASAATDCETLGIEHEMEWVKYSQTCTVEGCYKYECKNCDYVDESKTEVIPCHNYEDSRIGKIPTCTEEGLLITYCAWCMEVKTEAIEKDPENHNFGLWSVIEESTCSKQGQQIRTCSRCNETETKDLVINPTKHNYVNWEVVTESDCSVEGVEKSACEYCGKVTTRALPCHYDYEINEGNYRVVESDPGTCHKLSWKKYQCNKCYTVFTVNGGYNEDGHDFTDESLWQIPADATCQNTAKIIKRCKNFHTHTIEEEYTAPHDFSGLERTITEPKCEKINGETVFTDGQKAVKCVNCDEEKIVAIENTHGFVDYEITEGACGKGGKYKRTCMCGDVTETGSFGDMEHPYYTWDGKNYVKGDCVHEGYKQTWCNICEKYTINFTPDLASKGGHVPGKYVEKEPATCNKSGVADNCCRVCGTVIETVPTAKLSHTIIVMIDGVDATCTKSGVTPYQFCTGCDTVFPQDIIPALGHNFVEQKEGEEGGKKICNRCFQYEIINDKGEQVTCKCLCHNTNGLAKFIYKIITFFSKIFGANQECKCGVLHY